MSTRRTIKVSGRTRDLVILADRAIYAFAKHWVACVTILLALYVIPFFLAPYLMYAGHEKAGRLVYALYRPACHQRPERSFFLFGPKYAYSWDELVDAGMDASLTPEERRLFLGSPALGYKTAVCQRDVTTYVSLVLLGPLYGLFARRWLRPLPLWGFLLFLLPLAIDGGTQALGLRESTPALRVLSGLCVALGSVWFAYPHVEIVTAEWRDTIARKLGLKP